MQDHRRLRVYTEAIALVGETYAVARVLPKCEQFGLAAQLRRSCISVGSNIAEGCGRSTAKELGHYLAIALGSARELEFQLHATATATLASPEAIRPAVERTMTIQRMLIRLMVRVHPRAAEGPKR